MDNPQSDTQEWKSLFERKVKYYLKRHILLICIATLDIEAFYYRHLTSEYSCWEKAWQTDITATKCILFVSNVSYETFDEFQSIIKDIWFKHK